MIGRLGAARGGVPALTYELDLEGIDRDDALNVGGKAAHLGELMRIGGVRVPGGFCVATDAFGRAVAEVPSMADRRDQLSDLNPDDREAIRTLSAEVRRAVEGRIQVAKVHQSDSEISQRP